MFIVLCSFSIMEAGTACWTIWQQGGKPNTMNGEEYIGFDKVEQDNHALILECTGSGASKCEVTDTPGGTSFTNHVNHMKNISDNKIYYDNVLVGSYNGSYYNIDEQTQYNTTIIWEATIDSYGDYNITQTINCSTAPQQKISYIVSIV